MTKDFVIFLKSTFEDREAFHAHLRQVRTYGDTPDFWGSFDTMTDAVVMAETHSCGAWIVSEAQDWKIVGETDRAPDEKRFTFSVDLIATATVTAKDEAEARAIVEAALMDDPDHVLDYGATLSVQLTDDDPMTLESAE